MDAAEPRRGARMKSWLVLPAAALIVCAVFFCYYMTTEAGFVYDDPLLIHDNPLVSNPSANFMDCFFQPYFGVNSGFYRPLMTLLFRIEFFQYEGQAFGFHLSNVIIHSLACVALFVLLLALGLPLLRSLAAGLVLAIHPVTTECVAWISGRTDPLSFFFMGMSLIFLVGFFRVTASGMRSGLGAGAVACFLLALLVKEAALVLLLPAGILVWMYTQKTADASQGAFAPEENSTSPSRPTSGMSYQGLYLFGALLFVGVFTFIIGRVLQGGEEIQFYTGRGNAFERGLTFLSLVPDYMQKLFVPIKQQLARPAHLVTSVANLKVWFGLIVLVAAPAAMIVGICKRCPALAAGSALFLVSLISVSNLFPIPYGLTEMDFPFFERYAYIPLAGLLMALASLGVKKCGAEGGTLIRDALPLVLVLCVSPVLIDKTKLRNQDWFDDASLFMAGVQSYPESPTMSFNLGQALMGAGEFRGAQAAFYQAALLDPDLTMARVQGAVSSAAMGRITDAVSALEAVLAYDPNNGQAQEALGFVHAGAGQWLKAFESYSKALPLLANNPTTLNSRDRAVARVMERMEDLFLNKKEYRQVLEMTDRVLAWLPGCTWAHEARGLALLELGQEGEAIKSLERALFCAGAPPMRAMEKLIPIYEKKGRTEEARQLQEQVDMINQLIKEAEQAQQSPQPQQNNQAQKKD